MPSGVLALVGADGLAVSAGGAGASDLRAFSRCCCSAGWSSGWAAWIWPAALWSSDCAVAGCPWRIATLACSIVARAAWAFCA